MVLPVIQKRRSIRKYLDKPIEQEKIDLLMEAVLRAPSSMGRDPWEFILVKDKSLLDSLSRAKPHGAAFLKGAAIGIVVCADKTKSDVWIEDTSIASTYLLLEAESLGLGACWIQIRKRKHNETISAGEHIRGLLNIPERLEILSIIAMGYPDETKSGHSKDTLKYDRIFIDGYGDK